MRRPFLKAKAKRSGMLYCVPYQCVSSATVSIEMYFFPCPRYVFFMTGLLEVDMYQKIL